MNAPAAIADVSGLDVVVERARSLLDDGDVMAARMLAAGAYDQAKAAASYAQRFGVVEKLVSKARQLQGDALVIEVKALVCIANEVDTAQAAGNLRSTGQRGPNKGRGANSDLPPTSRDIGLNRKQVFIARQLRDAERNDPGIVGRFVADRISQNLEPSRAALRANLFVRRRAPAELFRRTLHIDFNPADTSFEAARNMLARLDDFRAFLTAVLSHAIPPDRTAPLSNFYSDDDLRRFDEGDDSGV